MIIRLVCVDPEPRSAEDDLIVWQVPERSRAYEMLTQWFDENGIEWTQLEPNRGGQPRTKKNGAQRGAVQH